MIAIAIGLTTGQRVSAAHHVVNQPLAAVAAPVPALSVGKERPGRSARTAGSTGVGGIGGTGAAIGRVGRIRR